MPDLDATFLETASRELKNRGIDAWLLYDFRACNALAADLVGLPEGQKRRYFVLIAPGRTPHALVQKIEASGWDGWPHRLTSYVGWDEMEAELRRMLDGMDSVAMEVSPRDSIPYVDNVPAGVVELVESVGPRVVSSVDLISGTAAQWGARGTELHHRAAEILARTARTAFELAVRAAGLSPEADPGTADAFETAGEPTPETEHDLAEWIRARLRAEGLTEADTIVAVGPNAAKPHYEPLAEGSSTLAAERVFMVDLWGRVAAEPEAVFADQTWMGYLGPEPPADVTEAWDAVVAARDAAVDVIRANPGATGADADRAARDTLVARGYGDAIFHRTGHGIDRELHGVGPTLDSIEMRDDRRLVPGVGFSVEPGVYLEGRFGHRTEIDVYMREDGPEVTPSRIQYNLWRAADA
ncbi:M24 family metallopeptidase [Candidatus Palauibacter sp.]|uniref:M24 family metallopeptidase n=1 Tax=Candidatus Palauibacter sp. TaxID=3101350 RepID=UPI003C7009D5